MEPAPARHAPWSAAAAIGLFVITLLELGVAMIGAASADLTFSEAVSSYLVTNAAIGTSCAVSGVLLAWFRPRNPVGWLLAGAGVAQNLTAATAPLLSAAEGDGWSVGAVRTLATAYAYGWPWSIGLFLPMALLLFPTGRLPSRGWRWPAGLLVPAGVVFVLAMGAAPEGADGTGRMLPWLVLAGYDELAWLWNAANVIDQRHVPGRVGRGGRPVPGR